MKKIYFIILFSIIFLTSLFVTLYLRTLAWNFQGAKINLNQNKDKNQNYFQNIGEFGYVKVYNVTINKIIAEIGENITVSTVYSLLCNEGYEIGYGIMGIYKLGWFEYKNSLIDGVEFYNVSEIISINPNHFNANDTCKGRVEIEIFNISDPMEFIIYTNLSNENLELRKAKLNYSLTEQNPLTIFSEDIINFSILIHNEHTKKYTFSNNYIEINISNKNNLLYFSECTDSNGFLNFSVNCSLLGAGNYTIQLKNNETADYESNTQLFQLEVLDEVSCINCSLLNDEEVYTNVNYDDSNYSKAFYLIQCKFDANISWNSNFGNGTFSKVGNYYNATILSPNIAGTYPIYFIAQPIAKGKQIEFNKDLQVKRRPIELSSIFFRNENQSLLFFQIHIFDKLKNQLINKKNSINISVNYNDSNWEIGVIECNTSGVATFDWEIPNKIVEDYISFKFIFNATPTYQFSSLTKNLIVTKLEYSSSLFGYSTQNITIKARLYSLNGKNLANQSIKLRINDNIFNLITDLNGEISYSLKAPSYSTILDIEIHFQGSDIILSSTLKLNIEIKLNLLQKIWNSLGFILAGISIAIISTIYLKKILTKRNLANLNVD